MDATNVAWLHISDFHFHADGDMFSQQQATRALLESIQVEQKRHLTPSFAVVTGDVAFSGREAEYREAQQFLVELSNVTGIPPRKFYFVPGNHDVDRGRQLLAYHGGRSQIDSPEKVDYYLAEMARIEPLKQRQAAFWSFVEEFTVGQERFPTPDGLAYVARLSVGRATICLLGLNSAWLSGGDGEEMKLVIGERQVINALELTEKLKPHFTLALAHHPITWLTEWDAGSCRTRLLPAADLYLRGHLHAHEVTLTSSPAQPCVEIAAGSGHATRFYANSYNFASIDLRTARCTIQEYRYLPTDSRFQPTEPMSASVTIRGTLPASQAALANVIRSEVEDAASFANYLAGLLTGQLSELPVAVDRRVNFAAPAAVYELMSAESREQAQAFLALRNLLRLYESETPIETRVREHAGPIRQYAAALASVISIDPSCQARLRDDSRAVTTPVPSGDERSWSSRLLGDIRRSADWAQLEARARILVKSADPATRQEARAALAEALIHSDEAQKREEALCIASELASAAEASDNEIILAAGAAEVCRDFVTARRIVMDALKAGRQSPELVEHARNLSTRVGDRDLRIAAEQASARLRGGSE